MFAFAVRFHFSDLCDKPLGASDYLGIASVYHTVFVDNAIDLENQNL